MQEHFNLTFQEIEDDAQPVDWSLDEHTRMVGRQGIATARAILDARAAMASAA